MFRELRVVAFAAVVLLPAAARADAVDIVWFFTRVPAWDLHPITGCLILAALMAVNYLLNFLVIGLPAVKLGTPRPRVARDLIGFTLLGQVADRLGMVLSALILYVSTPASESELGLLFLTTVAASFLLSGVFVGLLARHYLTPPGPWPPPTSTAGDVRRVLAPREHGDRPRDARRRTSTREGDRRL
jgi:hypothetical protein